MYLSFLADNLFYLLDTYSHLRFCTLLGFWLYHYSILIINRMYMLLYTIKYLQILCSLIFIFYYFIISVFCFFFFTFHWWREKNVVIKKVNQLSTLFTNYMFEYFKSTKTLLNHTISTLLNICLKEVYRNFTQKISLRIYISPQLLELIYLWVYHKIQRKQRLNTQIAKLLTCNLLLNGLKNNSCILLNFKHI